MSLRLALSCAVAALVAGHTRLRTRAVPKDAAPAPVLAATQYYGKVKVGQPPQEFRVVFDTASGTMVIPSSRCEDSACMSHRRFDSEKSSSAVQIGWADDPVTPIHKGEDRDAKGLSLLGADVSGEFIRDSVCVGGQGGFCSTIDFVGLTEESSDPFSQLDFDGVLGLAPSSPDAKEFNFLQSVLGARASAERVFSLYLAAPGAAAGSLDGELTFGGYHAERAASEFHWAPVASNGSWHIVVDDIAVGGKRLGLCKKGGCEASVDSGSSLIMAPGNMLWNLLTKMGIDDDCSAPAPPLSFIVQGQPLELNMEDYVEKQADGCRLLFGSTSIAEKAPALVLGYPFLRKFFTVFDVAQNRVGFALANHASKPKARAGVVAVPLVGIRP